MITFEELKAIEDEDARDLAAIKSGPVLYRFGDSVHRGMGLNLGGPVETDDMVEGVLVCIACGYYWRGRRPSFFKGLACPHCYVLSGTPPEKLEDLLAFLEGDPGEGRR